MSTFLYAQIAQQRKTAAASAATATPGVAIRNINKAADNGNDGKQTQGEPGNVSGYVEAMAALVPSEVLTLHALILSATTRIIPAKEADGAAKSVATGSTDIVNTTSNSITVISDASSLAIAFWVLALISIALYLVPRLYAASTAAKEAKTSWQAQMGAADWARAAVPPLAFTAWAMLQRATAFDAVCGGLTDSQRTVFGLLLAAVMIAVASWLAYKPAPPANG